MKGRALPTWAATGRAPPTWAVTGRAPPTRAEIDRATVINAVVGRVAALSGNELRPDLTALGDRLGSENLRLGTKREGWVGLVSSGTGLVSSSSVSSVYQSGGTNPESESSL